MARETTHPKLQRDLIRPRSDARYDHRHRAALLSIPRDTQYLLTESIPMKPQRRMTLFVFVVIWLTVQPLFAEQSTSDRAQLLKAVLNYTEAEGLANTDPDAALHRLRNASRDASRCKPGNTIRAEEIAVLNMRITTLREQIHRRLQLTDEIYKTTRGFLKQHRLASLAQLLNNAPEELYLHQMRFEEIRSQIVADSEKAFEFVQIGHSHFNRREFKKAKHWYQEALKLNREYPKLWYYLEQAKYRASQGGFLWGLF